MSTHGTPVLKLAPPYDDELIRRIERGFSLKLGTEIRFEVVEDPLLLCGFVAYLNGTVYDVSGKTQLSGISEHLLDSLFIPPPETIEDGEDDEGEGVI